MGERRSMTRRLTRQEFLVLSAGAGAAFALAGCGGGGPESNPAVQQAAAGSGKSYNGPKVSLSFWNGFTGGGGHFIRGGGGAIRAPEENIGPTRKTPEWPGYCPKGPAPVGSREGADPALM